MRDIVIFALVFGMIPMMLKRPAIGALVFMWLSLMNPHRLAYGAAYNFPFAAVVGGVTLLAVLFTKEQRKYPLTPVTVLLVLFAVWMTITSFFGLNPAVWTRISLL